MNDVVSDFIALDVETANADFASICSIGLVHFRSGDVFKSITILVDPEDEFDPINISIHGVRPEDVRGKPTMAQVSLEDVVVVHHSSFDKTALTRAASKYGVSNLPCVWLDTVRVARRAWPHFKADGGGHGLARLAQEFGIQFRHHDAAEDARAAGLVLQRAMAETGLSIAAWIDRVERPILMPSGGDRPVCANPAGPLFGETIVFTGRLAFTRSEAADVATRAGCQVAGGVTQGTTILVVGDQDLRATKGNEKSAKHRKAEKLILDGCPIRIVGESDFLRMTNGSV